MLLFVAVRIVKTAFLFLISFLNLALTQFAAHISSIVVKRLSLLADIEIEGPTDGAFSSRDICDILREDNSGDITLDCTKFLI